MSESFSKLMGGMLSSIEDEPSDLQKIKKLYALNIGKEIQLLLGKFKAGEMTQLELLTALSLEVGNSVIEAIYKIKTELPDISNVLN